MKTWPQIFTDLTALQREYRRRALSLCHSQENRALTLAVEQLLASTPLSSRSLEYVLTHYGLPGELEESLVALEEIEDLRATVSAAVERHRK